MTREEVKKIRETPVTDNELRDAKTNLRGRSSLEIESNRGLMMKLISVAYHDLGDDYMANVFKNIDAVTRDQVMEVAEKYLDPDKFLLAIVGNKTELKDVI